MNENIKTDLSKFTVIAGLKDRLYEIYLLQFIVSVSESMF